MPSVLHSSGRDDAELARRVGAGDMAAFAALDARHRKPLIRYAGSLLRRSEHDAEDVVQDVLIRAHDALRCGEGPEQLRPWLYRLVRNRAIDEVRRARWGDEALDGGASFAGDGRDEPMAALRRKESMRRLVDDLADLPLAQRAALLGRELDGQSAEQVAAQLGVSVDAAQKLTMRARQNLVKARAARDADCVDVRALVLDAHERGVRSTEHALRHVKGCDACRAYQRDVRRLTKQLHGLSPTFGLPIVAAVAKLLGVGGATAAVGVATALVVAVSGGIVVLDADIFKAGERMWFKFDHTDRNEATAYTVPDRTTVVTTHIRVPAGAPADRRLRGVTLVCPPGTKLAGLANPPGRGSAYGLSHDSFPGYSTRGRIEFVNGPAPPGYDRTVGIVCRQPGPSGSIVEHPRPPEPGERAGHICRNGTRMYRPPPGRIDALLAVRRMPRHLLRTFRRSAYDRHHRIAAHYRPYEIADRLYEGQPLSVQPRRDATGRWTRVVLDSGHAGWVRTTAVCP